MNIITDDRPLPADCETMLDVRKGVDALDRALVLMLAERQRYMDAAARIKGERHTVLDTARIEDVVDKVKAAARAAAAFNNDNRIKEEAQIVDFFKQQGLTVTTPDVDAFRKQVQQAYATSEIAKTWPKGLLERINATQ